MTWQSSSAALGLWLLLTLSPVLFAGVAEPPTGVLTYSNQPLGTAAEPLVLRTYSPNPGLDSAVTARHGVGEKTPKYSSKTGLLSTRVEDEPIAGIPAAISVSAGPTLSYVWDTTECRLLYAWANGFLDMQPYWGDPDRGSRKSHDYVPRLIGHLFYKARGDHPLRINGEPLAEQIRYSGHRRVDGHPQFSFRTGGRVITVGVTTAKSDQTLILNYTSSEPGDRLTYVDPSTPFEVVDEAPGKLSVLLRPNAAESYTGFQQEVIEITEASAEVGAKLYQNFGCMACHSIDGSRNHGPTFQGLAGRARDFPGIGKVTADEAYLRESITQPVAKSVPEFPVGMMPPYPLGEKQVDSLILYIQSIK
jgi:mono/diheme cytochrome c family protein